MKKFSKVIKVLPIGILFCCVFTSCNFQNRLNNDVIPIPDHGLIDDENTSLITYEGVQIPTNYQTFIDEIRKGNTNNNDAGSYGIVYSPYYTIKLPNESEFTAYAANVVQGLSSFMEVKKDENDLLVNVKFYQQINSVKFYCVDEHPSYTTIDNNTIQLVLTECKSYTICINNDLSKCLTLFVEKEVKFERGNSEVIIYNAGVHDYTIQAKPGEAIYFARGIHQVRNIVLNSNTQLYFEDGAYIKCINPSLGKETPTQNPDTFGQIRYTDFITARKASDIKIYGHGLIDCYRLDWHTRSGIRLIEINNLSISDLMFNNPAEWTMDIACCIDVNIQNIKIFGYRQNSDGICIEDCQNSLVENCFARSGDDLFEVKSRYGQSTIEIKNLKFKNCVAWPEKARGLGVIAETSRDINDAKWENCVVIAYTPKWMKKLGACVIIGEGKGKISNITFENIKIYNNDYFPINVTVGNDSSNQVRNVLFKNIYFEKDYNICIENDSSNGTISDITFESVKSSNYNLINRQDTISKVGPLGTITVR